MRRLKLRPGALPAGISFFHPATLIATGFGVGFAPIASGTWGSLVALPLGWLIHGAYGVVGLLVASAIATLLGIGASHWLVTRGDVGDPGYIVIDEIAAQLLTLAFVPQSWWAYAIAFVAFRLADIFKPFPANWCDAHIHGGLGVMLDDLVAAIYAGIASWLACRGLVSSGFLDVLGG